MTQPICALDEVHPRTLLRVRRQEDSLFERGTKSLDTSVEIEAFEAVKLAGIETHTALFV